MARGSILEKNSGVGGLLLNIEHITANKTLDKADSGKVFMCSSADGAVAITLPTVGTGDASAENGLYYKFIVWEETPTADITIGAGSAIVSLVAKDAGADAGASTAGTQVSNIILDTTAQRGDYVEMTFWNGEWVASSLSAIDGGITTS